jgi:hypothetical protein
MAVMKTIQSMIAVTAFALGMAAPASAATTDPEVIIYRFPGVIDSGTGQNTGVATVFHCTNFSGVVENIRFVTRAANGNLLTNVVFPNAHLATLTAATHETAFYSDSATPLNTGGVAQGTTAIAATSINVVCTAVTIDAAPPAAGGSLVPNGFALRGIRFSPVPGSQE